MLRSGLNCAGSSCLTQSRSLEQNLSADRLELKMWEVTQQHLLVVRNILSPQL
jgi:hypothetical protein